MSISSQTTPNKISNLRPLLGSEYRVSSASLDGENIVPVECYATIVAADLRIVHNIAVLKGIFLKYRNVPRRIFLIDHRARLFPAEAYALGAAHVLFNPVAQRDLLNDGRSRRGSLGMCPASFKNNHLSWCRRASFYVFRRTYRSEQRPIISR